MPPWFQQILVAFSAFVGGRIVTSVGERMKEAKDLRLSVDRLALAVEQVPVQINNLQAEIHRVGARNEAQMEALRDQLHDHKLEQEKRFGSLEIRVDRLASTPPPPPPPPMAVVEPGARLRVDQERRCYLPHDGEQPD